MYRYGVARWGYSPALLSWELFNEMDLVDGFSAREADAIAFHRRFVRMSFSYYLSHYYLLHSLFFMSQAHSNFLLAIIRNYDNGHKHLVTTNFAFDLYTSNWYNSINDGTQNAVFATVDFNTVHRYFFCFVLVYFVFISFLFVIHFY